MTHLFQNYARSPLAFTRGEGLRLYAEDGREYLDFTSGIGVTNLGHAHPQVTAAIREQAANLLHCSNLFTIPGQEKVAAKLAAKTGLQRTFFCNSGAEANEGAIKLARKHSQEAYGAHKHEILTFHDAFHGRTLATVAATPRPAFQAGFAPLMPGFRYVEKDLRQVEEAISDATCAILIEPVQGEGGVQPMAPEFLQGLRALCDRHGLLLIFDEVQTGIGRTGTLFAFEQSGVVPDILTLAKGLGNGVPVGAVVAREEVALAMRPGSHGTTFGGTPLVMAAALAVLETIEAEDLLANTRAMGQELGARLHKLVESHDFLLEARGLGLMRGLVFNRPVAPVVAACRELGLLVLSAGDQTLRLLPALTVTSQDIHLAMTILQEALEM